MLLEATWKAVHLTQVLYLKFQNYSKKYIGQRHRPRVVKSGGFSNACVNRQNRFVTATNFRPTSIGSGGFGI